MPETDKIDDGTVPTSFAAKILGASPDTVQRMIANGELDAEKINHHKLNSPFRIGCESLLQLLQRFRAKLAIGSIEGKDAR
jgi:excisionase family DNA binding protein